MHGCGASDMKGGVAVALELVRELAERDPGPVDVGLLLFGREELPPQDNPLPALFDACPLVHEADLAVLLEPTDLTIQAGCVGNLTARVTFHGVSGHSARPWLADNAIAPRDRRACAGGRSRAPRGGRSTACRSTRSSRSRGSRVAWPTTSSPTGRWRRSTSATRPTARRERRRTTCARSSRPTRPSRSSATRPPARSSVDAPLVQRAPRGRRPPGRAEAGVDERRRLHVPGDPRGQLRAGRHALRPPPRRAGRDRGARARLRRSAARRPRRDGRMTDR